MQAADARCVGRLIGAPAAGVAPWLGESSRPKPGPSSRRERTSAARAVRVSSASAHQRADLARPAGDRAHHRRRSGVPSARRLISAAGGSARCQGSATTRTAANGRPCATAARDAEHRIPCRPRPRRWSGRASILSAAVITGARRRRCRRGSRRGWSAAGGSTIRDGNRSAARASRWSARRCRCRA